jgi:parvulin-like peptidyl-prolyl isomerase
MEPGQVMGPLDAGSNLAIVELVEKSEASRQEFRAVANQVQARLIGQRQQQWLSQWMEALRESADVQDMRDRLDQQSDQGGGRRAAGGL